MNRTILIVDDDMAVRKTFARMLRVSGFGVLTADNIEAALFQVSRGRPAAAIVDLRLPRSDGMVFLRRLRASETNHPTPVAIVTGDYFLDDAILRELKFLNATVYFKPLWLEDLLHIAAGLIDIRSSKYRED